MDTWMLIPTTQLRAGQWRLPWGKWLKPFRTGRMLERLHLVFPFKYALADSIHGESEDFTAAVGSHLGMIHFVQVSRKTRIWLREPVTRTQEYQYKGQRRSKKKTHGWGRLSCGAGLPNCSLDD